MITAINFFRSLRCVTLKSIATLTAIILYFLVESIYNTLAKLSVNYNFLKTIKLLVKWPSFNAFHQTNVFNLSSTKFSYSIYLMKSTKLY